MIPADWHESPLGEVVNHTKGFAFKSTDYVTTGGRRIIRVSDTDENSIGSDNPVFIPEVKALEYKAYELKEGDLILTTVGSRPPMYSSMVGKAIRVPKPIEGALLNQNMVKLSPIYEKADPSFLYAVLKTQRFLFHIECSARGNANQASITLDDIFEFNVPLPPFVEQQRIAEILGCWDKAIELTETLTKQRSELFVLLRQLLVTGGARFQNFKDAPLNSTKFGTLLSESRIAGGDGRTAQKLTIKLYGKGIEAKSSSRSGSESTRYYKRKAGQFIYSKLDFLNGAFAIVPQHLDGYESTLDLPSFDVSDSVNPEWLLHYVSCPAFYQNRVDIAVGGRKARRVNPSEFYELKLKLPSRDEQDRVANTLNLLKREIDLEIECLEALKMQKLGLMQQLLTGKKRVKV